MVKDSAQFLFVYFVKNTRPLNIQKTFRNLKIEGYIHVMIYIAVYWFARGCSFQIAIFASIYTLPFTNIISWSGVSRIVLNIFHFTIFEPTRAKLTDYSSLQQELSTDNISKFTPLDRWSFNFLLIKISNDTCVYFRILFRLLLTLRRVPKTYKFINLLRSERCTFKE